MAFLTIIFNLALFAYLFLITIILLAILSHLRRNDETLDIVVRTLRNVVHSERQNINYSQNIDENLRLVATEFDRIAKTAHQLYAQQIEHETIFDQKLGYIIGTLDSSGYASAEEEGETAVTTHVDAQTKFPIFRSWQRTISGKTKTPLYEHELPRNSGLHTFVDPVTPIDPNHPAIQPLPKPSRSFY